MLSKAFANHYDRRRLRNLLAILFAALTLPTAVLIWHAYGQLKWESYYQYRVQAEELTRRIDSAVATGTLAITSREATDYAFLNSSPSAKIQQRSPLAAWPVPQDLPGLIGYFQVDADGQFSTPLLPATDLVAADVGLADDDFARRQALAGEIQTILAKNRLVRDRVSVVGRLESEVATEAPMPTAPRSNAPPAGMDVVASDDSPSREVPGKPSDSIDSVMHEVAKVGDKERAYSQDAFAQLNQVARSATASVSEEELDDRRDMPVVEDRDNALVRIEDLKLDEALQKKSEELRPQVAAPEQKAAQLAEDAGEFGVDRKRDARQGIRRAPEATLTEAQGSAPGNAGFTITAFESETDPYEFSMLDSGQLVLFRNAWLNGERAIQGLLIDQSRFIDTVIASTFRASTLAGMSSLVVGYNDNVIRMLAGGSYRGVTSAAQLDGELLFRSQLSAPFDGLELIFTVNHLPPGPGAAVLAWTTVIIAIVFLGGFFALYRLGLTQIRLARQQQDFVSAVSHELKTPLTSIRMYGEMLKEGWADESKRQQYYEYIHDESERLTRLISNVLQLAKISRNEPQFSMKLTSVNSLIDQVRSKIASQVEQAGFEFNLVIDDIDPDTRIRIDEDCFVQVVINLVDNAIKFSKSATRKSIDVSCRLTRDNRVEFCVRDYGPGIPANQMKKIFKLFYRMESELTRETVGTGIGLAIVHQLTTAMSGKVDVRNRDPGAEFNVSFPSMQTP